jgi:hypothetical protein
MLAFKQRRSAVMPQREWVTCERRRALADLETGSYPEETLLSLELLSSVCKESFWNPDSDSGDSERGPRGDERGLGSPMADQQHSRSTQSARAEVSIPRALE